MEQLHLVQSRGVTLALENRRLGVSQVELTGGLGQLVPLVCVHLVKKLAMHHCYHSAANNPADFCIIGAGIAMVVQKSTRTYSGTRCFLTCYPSVTFLLPRLYTFKSYCWLT